MKSNYLLGTVAMFAGIPLFYATVEKFPLKVTEPVSITVMEEGKHCVFMTIMGEQTSEGYSEVKLNEDFATTIVRGEEWLVKAQNNDGGWGAGSRANQREMNPHAVASDPATTAMSAMALYRGGYNLESGKYSQTLRKALDYLLAEIESNRNSPYITGVRGTQIQGKLGEHIDAIMALQFLNQVFSTLDDPALKTRVGQAIQECVNKVEKSIDNSGKVGGAGWAGVLQSSFAGAGLEMAARNEGIKVDQEKLQKTREYQKGNYNPANEEVNTREGAGIVLYSVSSSVRNSAAESREAEKLINKAIADGIIEEGAQVNEQNLLRIGVAPAEVKSYVVADKVYRSAREKAMQEDVLKGYGNNGGEEFMSFLQTGESMIVNNDESWKKWYDNIGGKIMNIQNRDGSWNGHHCITSPVFCTATCLLILTIENDIERLQMEF